MKRKKKKGINPSGMRCPYCGKPLILRSADGIYHENPKTPCFMSARIILSVTPM